MIKRLNETRLNETGLGETGLGEMELPKGRWDGAKKM